jgi:hypothetical protein
MDSAVVAASALSALGLELDLELDLVLVIISLSSTPACEALDPALVLVLGTSSKVLLSFKAVACFPFSLVNPSWACPVRRILAKLSIWTGGRSNQILIIYVSVGKLVSLLEISVPPLFPNGSRTGENGFFSAPFSATVFLSGAPFFVAGLELVLLRGVLGFVVLAVAVVDRVAGFVGDVRAVAGFLVVGAAVVEGRRGGSDVVPLAAADDRVVGADSDDGTFLIFF